MAPSVKLTYFNIRGLAEVIRMLLKYGDIEFEDVRLEHDDWPKIKQEMPFGQLPTYEENGKIASQSVAIARYVAKKVNLVGGNDWENLQIDATVDTIFDIREKIGQFLHEENVERKETLKETFFKETLPYYLVRFEKVAKENNGHLALPKLTWADVFFAATVEATSFITDKDILENCPNLKAVKDNVFEIPAIKKWIATRPQTNV